MQYKGLYIFQGIPMLKLDTLDYKFNNLSEAVKEVRRFVSKKVEDYQNIKITNRPQKTETVKRHSDELFKSNNIADCKAWVDIYTGK